MVWSLAGLLSRVECSVDPRCSRKNFVGCTERGAHSACPCILGCSRMIELCSDQGLYPRPVVYGVCRNDAISVDRTEVERTVDELERVNIISQTLSEEERVPAYQPAVDISRLTLGYLLRAIDREGDEDFICNLKADFPKEWAAIIDTRRLMEEKGDSIALKDLKIEESRVLSHKLNNNE